VAGGEGFEPSTPNLGEAQTCPDSNFWPEFKVFLGNLYESSYENQLFNNAQRFYPYFAGGNLSILSTFSDSKRLNVMKALSALSKFAGCNEYFRQMLKAHGLKWSVNNDDIIIARLMKYSGDAAPNDLFNWIAEVKARVPALSVFMDFTVCTGLRLDEAVNSYRLIVELGEDGKLGAYYNPERQVLEHFRFRKIFIRRTKKAYMSFASTALIDAVQKSGLYPTHDVIHKRMQRAGLNIRFSDLRELYASYSVKHLKQPEIDFLQGRVSSSVFMQNYFNPTWISGLKKRALKNGKELMKMAPINLKSLLN